MRIAILFAGLLISTLGILALASLRPPESFAFFQGALTLGGGILICFLFSFRMKWHGIVGAGILGLLGFARGLGNLPHLAPPHIPDTKAVMECAVTLVSAALLAATLLALAKGRKRRTSGIHGAGS